jgi:hypothetical protein
LVGGRRFKPPPLAFLGPRGGNFRRPVLGQVKIVAV